MSRPLQHSTAVITGASSGIGRAAALAFADAGTAVLVTARRSRPLEELVQECRARGAQAHAMAADVTELSALEGVARDAAGRFGRIDVWVNNAAVNVFGRAEEVPAEDWRRVVETDLMGTYHGIRAALPWLREQGDGVVINVGSILSRVPAPYQSAYVASKHGIRALSDSMRQELRDVPGIAVCTILPGAVDTPLFQHAGNYTGRRPKPPPPVLPAERVAAAIVACARRPRREVRVGVSTRGGMLLRRLRPAAAERAAARVIDRQHFLDEPAEPTSGNVHEPVDAGTDVSGGWRVGDDRHRRRRKLLAGAGAVAGMAAVMRRRPER